jgi:hypothetical protein
VGCETSQGIHRIQNAEYSTGTEHNRKHITTDLHNKKKMTQYTYITHHKNKIHYKRAITLKKKIGHKTHYNRALTLREGHNTFT